MCYRASLIAAAIMWNTVEVFVVSPWVRPSAKPPRGITLHNVKQWLEKTFPHECCSNPFRILHLESCLMSPSINVYYRQPTKSNTIFPWVPPNKYYFQILLVIQKFHMWWGWCWTTHPSSPGAPGKSLGWWESILSACGDWPWEEKEREHVLG